MGLLNEENIDKKFKEKKDSSNLIYKIYELEERCHDIYILHSTSDHLQPNSKKRKFEDIVAVIDGRLR